MKNRNNVLIAKLVALAFAFAPVIQAAPSPDGGPVRIHTNEAPSPNGGPVYPRIDPIPRAGTTPVPRQTTTPVNSATNEGNSAESDARAESDKMPIITVHS